MAKILIVDDEPDLLDLLQFNLETNGYEVVRAANGRTALDQAKAHQPDLIVLDVMLPDLQGFEVLRKLRSREASRSTPVILLTARGDEADVLIGFELGADDYVVKPFSPRALLARVRAILKRASGEEERQAVLRFGDLAMDLEAHRVFLHDAEISLTPQEFKLLSFLAAHPNRAYSREQLLEHAWGVDTVVDLRTVDVHIRRLRAQIEADPAHPQHIETVRGSGYRFSPGETKGS